MFAHLNIHTQYSLLDGLCAAEELFPRAQELGIRALAITDHCTLAGVPEFLKAAKRYPTVQPIIGCEVNVNDDERAAKGGRNIPLVLLAKNLTGYHNLVKIVSYAHINGRGKQRPYVSNTIIRQYHDGLICLSAGIGGVIPRAILAGDLEYAEKTALWYQKVFGEDFYLEVMLQKTEVPELDDNVYRMQAQCYPEMIRLGAKLGIKVIAANDVHFINKEDGPIHDKFVSLGQPNNESIRIRYTLQEYLKSEEEMRSLFPEHPEVIENTMDVARKIKKFDIYQPVELPVFPVPEKVDSRIRGWIRSDIIDAGAYDQDGLLRSDEYFRSMSYLCHLAFKGAKKRYGKELPGEVKERLGKELKTICKMGYADYFLIVQDYVNWAKKKGFLVGPGRGCAPGSLVVYCLGITDIDPLRFGLLFERFMNPENPSSPDIDVDIDNKGRQQVVDYLVEKYGKDHVGLVICYGTIPRKHPAFDVHFENVIRQKGIHAFSIIISRKTLDEYLPVGVCIDNSSGKKYLISHYSAKYVDKTGVMQLDIINLDALSKIKKCVSLVKRHHGVRIEFTKNPLNDSDTYALFCKGETDGVFHFEDQGIRGLLQALKPDCIEDLMAMKALYWPNSLSLIPELIARKHGTIVSGNALPEVTNVLAETYGLTIYQEQIMEIVQQVVDFPPEYSDELRRALCRQDKTMLDEIKMAFLMRGGDKGLKYEQLGPLWDSWVLLGRVIFNKSHAAAYAWLAYQIAWLKAHYPEEFTKTMLRLRHSGKSDIYGPERLY